MIKKLIICRTDGIGDVILTLPVAIALSSNPANHHAKMLIFVLAALSRVLIAALKA